MLTDELIKEKALSLGAHGCGIAGIERFSNAPKGFSPSDVFSKCKSVVVMIKQMPTGSILAENPVPYTHASYKMYEEMDRISMELLRYCQAHDTLAVMVPADVPYLYWDQENMEGRGIISLKHAAVQAGIGFMGRNTLFINRDYGNMVYLGANLIDTMLEQDDITTDFECFPDCTLCIDICPQKAIKEGLVNQKLCREHSFFKAGRDWDLYNCNKCRKICPLMLGEIKNI